jgi:hypothetical protein
VDHYRQLKPSRVQVIRDQQEMLVDAIPGFGKKELGL